MELRQNMRNLQRLKLLWYERAKYLCITSVFHNPIKLAFTGSQRRQPDAWREGKIYPWTTRGGSNKRSHNWSWKIGRSMSTNFKCFSYFRGPSLAVCWSKKFLIVKEVYHRTSERERMFSVATSPLRVMTRSHARNNERCYDKRCHVWPLTWRSAIVLLERMGPECVMAQKTNLYGESGTVRLAVICVADAIRRVSIANNYSMDEARLFWCSTPRDKWPKAKGSLGRRNLFQSRRICQKRTIIIKYGNHTAGIKKSFSLDFIMGEIRNVSSVDYSSWFARPHVVYSPLQCIST